MKTKSTFIIHLGGLKNIRPSIFDAIHVVEGRTSWAIDLPQMLSCLMETDRILQAFEAASDLGHCRILQGKSVSRRTQRSAGARDPTSTPVSCGNTGHAPRTQALSFLFKCVLCPPGSGVPSFSGIGQQKIFAQDGETRTRRINKGRTRPVLLTPEWYFEAI